MWGYAELVAWVRGGRDPSSVPSPFDDVEDALDWLPLEWHPDRFDVAEATAVIAAAMAAPVRVPDELAALRTRLEHRGDPALTHLLERAATHPVVEVDDSEAAQLVEPYLELLDAIGDGMQLAAAGYLPPAVVEQLAARTAPTTAHAPTTASTALGGYRHRDFDTRLTPSMWRSPSCGRVRISRTGCCSGANGPNEL